MIFIDCQIQIDRPMDFHSEMKLPQHHVYAAVHQDKIELFMRTSERKSKKLAAFLRKEGLFQKWNSRRPKLLKQLERQGWIVQHDIHLPFVVERAESVWQYLHDLFDEIHFNENESEGENVEHAFA